MKLTNDDLYKIIANRLKSGSSESYTLNLSKQGLDRVAQKVGEESTELIIEAMRKPQRKDRIIAESADLLFHFWVLLANCEITPDQVFEELANRHKLKNSSKQTNE